MLGSSYSPIKYTITEIEIGPHFLTVYCAPAANVVAEHVFGDILSLFPEIADIQQKNFLHENNDPKVYHAWGEAGAKPGRKCAKHFHIRFGYEPTKMNIRDIVPVVGKYADVSDYTVTHVEDFIQNEVDYPEIPRNHKEYLEMIDKLKSGK